jgi:thymidylate synthase
VEQADLQLGREPLPLPRLVLDPAVKSVFDFGIEHIRLEGYRSHPAIKAPVAV